MKGNVLTTTLKHLLNEDYSFKALLYAKKALIYSKLSYYKFIHSLNSKNRKTVIVYQMGKVGSLTVVKSLQALGNIDVYHFHALTIHGINMLEEYSRRRFHQKREIPSMLLKSQYLRKQLDKGLEDKWKVVTLVRDPIAKNISSFFSHLHGDSRTGIQYNLKDKIDSMKVEDIIEELRELFLEKFNRHEKPLRWLDSELKKVFDIDVFSREFPIEKGYEIYKAKSADVLLLRLENLNNCASDAFTSFLDIQEFNLVNSNLGSHKNYGNIYRMFLDSVVLPDSYIDKMYTSKYMHHFYSEEEIEAFKAKWRRQHYTRSK